MTHTTKEQNIANTRLFHNASAREVRYLARYIDQATAKPGQVLISQGTTGREVYFIASGEADVIRDGERVATLKAGDHFGELSIMDNQPRNATVVAKTELEVLVMGRREFHGVVNDMPDVARSLLTSMAGRLRDHDREVVEAAI